MRRTVITLAAIVIALLASEPAWAADGAALYKTRCANCHGAKGEGKPAMKSPAVKGNAMSADQMQKLLMEGVSGKKAPHAKAISGLNADQAKAIADFVGTL